MEKKHQGFKFIFSANGHDKKNYKFFITKICTKAEDKFMLLVQAVSSDDDKCMMSNGYYLPNDTEVKYELIEFIIGDDRNFEDIEVPEVKWEKA